MQGRLPSSEVDSLPYMTVDVTGVSSRLQSHNQYQFDNLPLARVDTLELDSTAIQYCTNKLYSVADEYLSPSYAAFHR